MTSIEGATPRRALLLGATFAGANPKNLALTVAASASIAEAGLDHAEQAISLVVFIALASVTVAGRSSSTSSTPIGPLHRSPRSSSSWPTTTR